MRVFFDDQIFSEQAYGGISRYFAALARELARLPDVTPLVSSPLCTNQYARSLPGELLAGVALPPAIGAGRLIRNVNRLISIPVARRFGPDVLHQTYYWNRRHPAPPTLGVVTTIHDMIHERYPGDFADQQLTTERKHRAVREADLVICVSENTRRDLVDLTGIDPEKTRVVHHGVDHLPATARPPERGSGRPYLLYVGQRDGYKNFGRLLRTWAGDSVLLGEFDLLCFGGGPWSTEERAEIGRLSLPDGRLIQAQGEDAVLVGLYQNAAAFVYPSMYEGFGIPPLEAMSQGCPVLSSNVSSMPEVLGDAAEYFPPEDRDALREALHRVLGDSERRTELQARGRERAARFTWRRCAEETLAAYRVLA